MKRLEIDGCEKCHHFDNQYYGYNEKCRRLDRVIKKKSDLVMEDNYPIPADCPLPDVDDV